ncbi:MAG TPA: nitroreductase family protein, partial [Bacillota bacterium]|nr:nitroreductase family protein [Bacillota bacterium]
MNYDNQVLQVIDQRHSIRMFNDQPLEEAALLKVLHAANQAPSAHNQQAWRFIIIEGEKKRELVELINAKAVLFPKSASVLLRMASRSIASAPAVIAVANTGELIEHGTELFGMEKAVAYDFF